MGGSGFAESWGRNPTTQEHPNSPNRERCCTGGGLKPLGLTLPWGEHCQGRHGAFPAPSQRWSHPQHLLLHPSAFLWSTWLPSKTKLGSEPRANPPPGTARARNRSSAKAWRVPFIYMELWGRSRLGLSSQHCRHGPTKPPATRWCLRELSPGQGSRFRASPAAWEQPLPPVEKQ